MKRGLLVLGVVLFLAGTSSADYIIIRVNLGGSGAAGGDADPNGGGAPGGPGFGGGGAPGLGGGGGPGAGPGIPGGGRGPGGGQGPGGGYPGGPMGGPGIPGGGRGPGGGGPGAGPGGGYPGGPMGGPGIPGGGRGPGGGQGPGGGRGPGDNGGAPGFGGGGGGAPGLGGGGGGAPGLGGPGFGGGGAPGFGGGGGGPGAGPDSPEVHGSWFITVVDAEVTFINTQANGPSGGWFVKPRFAPQMALNPTSGIPGEIVMQHIRFDKAEKFLADKKKQFADDPFRFAEWMLQHWNFPLEDGKFDMQKEFEKYIDELANKPGDPSNKPRIDALRAVRDQLKKPLADPIAEIKQVENLPGITAEYKQNKTPHYVMFHIGRDEKLADRKLKRLERTYSAFCYWFALMGKPVKQPEKLLVAILPEDREKFESLHRVFDSLPMVNDGFFANLDNVAILSKNRTDAPYEQFQTLVGEFEKSLGTTGLSLEKILDGKIPPNLLRGQGAMNATDLAKGKILALAARAALEEGELATATFEGVQQLVAATDLLPRRVQVPQAIRFGLASFFETPKSYGELDYPCLWSGVGGNHWVHLRLYKKLNDSDKRGVLTFDKGAYFDKSVKIDKLNLLKIITDQNFEAIAKAPKDDRDVLRDKARAEAWAVTHFMLRQRLPQTLKFWNEIAQLPRDMDLSPEVIESCLARAFELEDANNPHRADADKLASFERSWRDFMNFQSLELTDAQMTDNSIDKGNQRPGPGR